MLKRRPKTPEVPQGPSPERLAAIGAELRAAREARGEELEAVAQSLFIRPHHLAALERGDAVALPPRPYALGFLRAYALHLGLDAESLVARLKEAAPWPAAPVLGPVEPNAGGGRPLGALVAASLLLAAGIYGGVHLLGLGSGPVPELVAEAPGELAGPSGDASLGPALVEPPRSEPAATAVAVPVAAEVAAPAPPSPPPAPSQPAADATSAVAAESPPTEPVAAPRPIAVFDVDGAPPADRSEAGAEGRVVLLARESSWVQVRSAARDWVRTRTLAPGERFPLPDRADLALWTGNAGGVELLVDGRSVGLVGAPGAVVKDLPLAPESLLERVALAPR